MITLSFRYIPSDDVYFPSAYYAPSSSYDAPIRPSFGDDDINGWNTMGSPSSGSLFANDGTLEPTVSADGINGNPPIMSTDTWVDVPPSGWNQPMIPTLPDTANPLPVAPVPATETNPSTSPDPTQGTIPPVVPMPAQPNRPLFFVSPDTPPCNGDRRLCALRYDQVTFPGTHNSGAYKLKLDCSTRSGAEKFFCKHGGQLIPELVYKCFWENQHEHDVMRQLSDGIRNFDIDTAEAEGKAYFNHGADKMRALSPTTFDAMFFGIRQWMEKNPREIITLNFMDQNGDSTIVGNYLVDKLLLYLGPLLLRGTYRGAEAPNAAPWPTLGEMIARGQRIVLFVDGMYDIAVARASPSGDASWIRKGGQFYAPSYWYAGAGQGVSFNVIDDRFHRYCDAPAESTKAYWQCLDFEAEMSVQASLNTLKKNLHLGLCIGDTAEKVNGHVMHKVVDYCSTRLPFIHRIRVDFYWLGESVVDMAKKMNELNIRRAGVF